MNDISKFLIAMGALIILAGILWNVGIKIGKIPGDIIIDKGTFKFYFPIATSIIASIIVSILFYIVRRIK